MAEGRPSRRLTVTVRGAGDLAKLIAAPYVVLHLGGTSVRTEPIKAGGANPVWDEEFELELPPPLPNEQPLQLKVQLMAHVRLFPDRLVASGTQVLDDVFYGGGQHEVTVPLSTDGKSAGHLHLGLQLRRQPRPGEDVGSAAGTMLGEVPGLGPASAAAAAVPGPVLPSAETGEMQAREELGAGSLQDPSKPAYGLHA